MVTTRPAMLVLIGVWRTTSATDNASFRPRTKSPYKVVSAGSSCRSPLVTVPTTNYEYDLASQTGGWFQVRLVTVAVNLYFKNKERESPRCQ